ncbi:MAG: tetratricopeptide repeat protein [Candidatus Cloacimonetes bacterium]|nr:tetratricopeptide repeat protein [Candidatus Cloacimonadota bacterium]
MKILFHFYTPFVLLCMVLMAMLSSCAYYNTFYNAQKYFESAQEKPLTSNGRPNSQAIEEYNKVIRKCGVILTEYKDSKWVDDALFLLAKSLYYRGNNQIQALEKFEDIQNFYPDSPYLAESIIYSAKIKFELNKKQEAFTTLRDFIQNVEYKESHPKALIELSNMFLSEKDYLQAQTYLTMLITKYPDSKDFAEAYLMLGKTYLDNENYNESLNVFLQLNKSKVSKRYLLDAKYFIALSYFNLADYQKAYDYIKILEKQEFRTDKLQEQNVLYARVIAEMGRYEDAIEALETIVTNNAKTPISAEAMYYIAEIYFTKLQNYEEAVDAYNNARKEYNRSEFAEKAITRSSVVSQIMQYHRHNTDVDAEQLIAEQFKLAEYFLYILNQPDSAMAIYNRIPEQRNYIITKIDSLNSYLDSLFIIQTDTVNDTVYSSVEDSLSTNSKTTDNDSTTVKIEKTQSSINLLNNDLEQYNTLFIPQTEFIKAVLYNQVYNDSVKVNESFNYLKANYPDNRFTESLREYLNGENVSYLTQYEKEIRKIHSDVMSIYPDSIEIVIPLLDSLSRLDINDLKEKVLYTLGFINYYDLKDTLNAKPYLDTLYHHFPSGEYTVFARNFYDGKYFIFNDRLPFILEEIRNNEALKDSLKDTLNIQVENQKSQIDSIDVIDLEHTETLKDTLNKASDEFIIDNDE